MANFEEEGRANHVGVLLRVDQLPAGGGHAARPVSALDRVEVEDELALRLEGVVDLNYMS